MPTEPSIPEMQRRVRRWLHDHTEDQGDGTLRGLNSDLAALELELRTLYAAEEATPGGFEALREKSVFRTVLESMVEGVIVTDSAGEILVFNRAAQDMLGQGPNGEGPEDWGETYGLFHLDGVTPYASAELPLSRALQGEVVPVEELLVRSPDGVTEYRIRATARPVKDQQGNCAGAAVIFHDVTGARQVEADLRRDRATAVDATRAKGEFLANMSHEIRTPLTAVLGFSDLLLDANLTESDRLNYIQAIRRNGEHLLGLINDILDLSKIQANRMRTEAMRFSLHQLLHEVASVMQVRAQEKGLAFGVVYETPIPLHIESDPMRVRQILLNLISNAVKFTPKGQVQLTVRCVDAGGDASRIEFAVSDTGIGLSAEEVAELFQPFQQANPSTTRQFGGTGLGLSICHSLAQVLGGEIRVQSVPGSGSTFTFALAYEMDPDAETVADHGHAYDARDEPDVDPAVAETLAGRVLLAEDGFDNQVLISTILERQGLEVRVAGNGEVAVAEAMQALTEQRPYDVILMDMQMPKLDGYGATARLRSRGYTGPIVALTAHAMAGERERCLAAGCDDYLTKPIARAVLLGAVQSHLHRMRGHEATLAEPPQTIHDDSGETDGPLYSAYADDPDLGDLVEAFVQRLPDQVAGIRAARESGDGEELRRTVHQLKGAAGSYGLMPVSVDAQAVEALLQEGGADGEVDDALERLFTTCGRVRHGNGVGDG